MPAELDLPTQFSYQVNILKGRRTDETVFPKKKE